MIDPSRSYTGTTYTMTAALLLAGFVVIPMVMYFSLPVARLSLWLAAISSGVCALLAHRNWRQASELSIPSILSPVPLKK